MQQRWRKRLYRKADGGCPVADFCSRIKKSSPKYWRRVRSGIERVALHPSYRKPPTSKPIGDGLLEVRVYGWRVVYIERPGLMVLLDGVKKDSDTIPEGDRRRILNYKADYLERCLQDEDEYDDQLPD